MAGLKFLYNLILKDAARGSGSASGILSIGKDVRKLADKKFQRYITTAKKQGVDLDKLSEEEIKYMMELNKPKAPQVLSNEEAFEFLNQFLNQGKKGEVIRGKFKPLVTVDSVITDIKKLEPMDSMKETNKVLRGEGKYKNLSKADREKIAGDESVTDHIFERNIEPDPEDFAGGGIAGMLGERPGYHEAGIVHAIEKNKKLERDLKNQFPPGRMLLPRIVDRRYPEETYRPYKTLEDIPPEVLDILMSDPTFDPKTFLEMDWAAPGHTYLERKYRGDEKKVGKLPRGTYYGMSGDILLNFPKFSEGKKGKVPAPFLDFDRMSNEEKAAVILHEMRHKNILEKEQLYEAQPEWVKKYPRGIDYAKERAFTTRRGPEITEHPGVKYKEFEKGFVPDKYLTGHELFNWFMDSRKFGTPKGKEWYPYFDKILKDEWEPYAKEIDKRSMELKSKPEHLGLAGGGIAGMLGEPTYQDEEHRVPYQDGEFVKKEDLPSGLKAEVGDPTPGWGLSDLVNKYFLYQKVIPGVGEETRKYLGEKFLNDLNAHGYSPKDFKAYIDEQFPESRAKGGRAGFDNGGPVTQEEYDKYVAEKIAAGEEYMDFDTYKLFKIQFPKAAGGRVPYNEGKKVGRPKGQFWTTGKGKGEDVVDPGFDELSADEWLFILKAAMAGDYGPIEYAGGGRAGFKLGGIDKMRRLFLQATGAGAATVGAAKSGLFSLFKGGSKSAKALDLTQVPIQNAEGMPSWFKPLVNRVIKEGDDVTKQFAWKERQTVHSAKLSENQGVKVTQDLDNQTISVEYQSADNMGGVDDAVYLEYTAPQVIEPPVVKGGKLSGYGKGVKTKAEFKAEEAFPHGTTGDYKDITMEGSNVVNKVKDLYSDTSALKQFGTNKALTKKELEIAKQKRQRVNEINNDLGEQDQLLPDPPDYDDFASGGRVPLVGGKLVKDLGLKFLNKIFGKDRMIEMRTRDPEMYQGLLEVVDKFRARDKAGLVEYMKKYLPHMDDAEIEDFIIGGYGTEGVHGQLIRLGSGRDYKGKIEMIKKLERANKLKDFDVTGRKPNASGGRVPMFLGGGLTAGKGLLRQIMRHHEKTGTTGLTGSKMLNLVNPKQFNEMLNNPGGIPAIAKEMIEKYTKEMKADRIGAVEHSLGIAKKMKKAKDKSKEMDKIKEALTKDFVDQGMDRKMVENLIDMFIGAKYPDYQKIKAIRALPNVTDEGILELENILKNLQTKDRKLNASGGLAHMVGE